MAYVEAISNGTEAASGFATRANACRSGYFLRNRVVVALNGTIRPSVVKPSISIREQLGGSEPATADLVLKGGSGYVPERGHAVVIGHGTTANRLFAGRILKATRRVHRHTDRRPDYTIEAAAATADLGWSTVANGAVYSSLSVTSLVQAVLSASTPTVASVGVAASFVAPDLPVLAQFTALPTETVTEAFDRLADAAGALWYVDADRRLHFYSGTDPQPRPTVTTLTGTSGDIWDVSRTVDLSRVVTRAVAVGDTAQTAVDCYNTFTRIPMQSVDAITSADGSVNLGFQVLPTRTSVAEVLLDGEVREFVHAYAPSAQSYSVAELFEAAPSSIISNSLYVVKIKATNAGDGDSVDLNDRMWATLAGGDGFLFRIASVAINSTYGTEKLLTYYVPTTGPGAPAPMKPGLVAAGATFLTPHFELVLASAGSLPERLIPAGTEVQAYYAAVNTPGANYVQSLCGLPFGYITAVAQPESGRPADLVKATTALLAAGTPEHFETVAFSTRETQWAPGTPLYVAITGGGETSAPSIVGSFQVTERTIAGFDEMADSRGPVCTVTLGRARPASLWRLNS